MKLPGKDHHPPFKRRSKRPPVGLRDPHLVCSLQCPCGSMASFLARRASVVNFGKNFRWFEIVVWCLVAWSFLHCYKLYHMVLWILHVFLQSNVLIYMFHMNFIWTSVVLRCSKIFPKRPLVCHMPLQILHAQSIYLLRFNVQVGAVRFFHCRSRAGYYVSGVLFKLFKAISYILIYEYHSHSRIKVQHSKVSWGQNRN